jgi:hypothetical protein
MRKGETTMTRKDIVLAALAPARGSPHTPVQVQKLLFLVDRNISKLVGGPYFNFQPYNYGPFDKAVYEVLEGLAGEGLVELCPDWKWNNYRLTEAGQKLGEKFLGSLKEDAREYIQRASDFVRSVSFTELISAIYKAYPEMRRNSVFQE